MNVLDVEETIASLASMWSARMCSPGTVRSSASSTASSSCSRSWIRELPIAPLSCTASAALMVWRKPGVPPSSRASMPSTKLCCFQGLVQLTVPPPGWSGTRLW